MFGDVVRSWPITGDTASTQGIAWTGVYFLVNDNKNSRFCYLDPCSMSVARSAVMSGAFRIGGMLSDTEVLAVQSVGAGIAIPCLQSSSTAVGSWTTVFSIASTFGGAATYDGHRILAPMGTAVVTFEPRLTAQARYWFPVRSVVVLPAGGEVVAIAPTGAHWYVAGNVAGNKPFVTRVDPATGGMVGSAALPGIDQGVAGLTWNGQRLFATIGGTVDRTYEIAVE